MTRVERRDNTQVGIEVQPRRVDLVHQNERLTLRALVFDNGSRSVTLVHRVDERAPIHVALHQKLVDTDTTSSIHAGRNRSKHLHYSRDHTEPWGSPSQHHVEPVIVSVFQFQIVDLPSHPLLRSL